MSSIGPDMKVLRKLFDFPMFRIDEVMAEEATRQSSPDWRSGNAPPTLDPSVEVLRETAASHSGY